MKFGRISKKVSNHVSSETWDQHQDLVLLVDVSPHDGATVLSVAADRAVVLCTPEEQCDKRRRNGRRNSSDDGRLPQHPSTTYLLPGGGYWTNVAACWGSTAATTNNNNNLVVAGVVSDGCVEVWHVTRQMRLFSLPVKRGGAAATAVSVAISPDGARLAVGMVDGTLQVWEISQGKRTHVLKPSLTTLFKTPAAVTAVSWSSNYNIVNNNGPLLLAAGLQSGAIVVWKSNNEPTSSKTLVAWKQHTVLEGHSRSVQCLQWTRDNKCLASGSMDATVRVWSMTSSPQQQQGNNNKTPSSATPSCCLATLEGHSENVASLQWHKKNAQWLATGSWDHSVKLWHVPSQRCVQTLQGHSDGVYSVAWHYDDNDASKDGCLVSGSLDQTVQYWKGVDPHRFLTRTDSPSRGGRDQSSGSIVVDHTGPLGMQLVVPVSTATFNKKGRGGGWGSWLLAQ